MVERLCAATVACVLVVTACAGVSSTSVEVVQRLPVASLADAPVTLPEITRAEGQVAATVHAVTDEFARELVANAAATSEPKPTQPPVVVLGAEIADRRVGMAFPADMDEPVVGFVSGKGGWVSAGPTDIADDIDEPMLSWFGYGESGDDSAPFSVVGGWAAPTVATVALGRDGVWLVTDTVEVAGTGKRGWAVAAEDVPWAIGPFDEVAAYDSGGRRLVASAAAFSVLPRVAAGLRGAGWRSADVGQRLRADADMAGFPHGPASTVAAHTVTIASYGWIAQFARDDQRVYVGAGPRDLALAGDVRVDIAVTRSNLDDDAVVTGTVESGEGGDVVAAGYAAADVAAVRIVFDDGAWLETPTRAVPEAALSAMTHVWAVHATRARSAQPRVAAYYEALDRAGDVIERVPANTAD